MRLNFKGTLDSRNKHAVENPSENVNYSTAQADSLTVLK
jgi:hypothetical protein